MRVQALIVAGLLVVLLHSACSDPSAACTADIRPAVEVTVRDAATQSYLVVVPRGVVRDGAFQDSLRVAGTTFDEPPRVATLAAADERRGIYTVQLEAEGYQPWDTSGVAVSHDGCHVITANLAAFLEVAP